MIAWLEYNSVERLLLELIEAGQGLEVGRARAHEKVAVARRKQILFRLRVWLSWSINVHSLRRFGGSPDPA